MKAISIRQPWAFAIVELGKDVENRDWQTRYRGPVLIHAAKGCTVEEFNSAATFIGWDKMRYGVLPRDYERGGIVGRAEIIDCVEHMDSRWFFGRYGFVLRNAEPLPFQPCRGQLGFFTPDFSEQPKQKAPRQGSLLWDI